MNDIEHYYDIEITYTSNANEGNSLSLEETALVIEKGITVSGKPRKTIWRRWTTTMRCVMCGSWLGRVRPLPKVICGICTAW